MIQGFFELPFAPVRDAFHQLFEQGRESGAALTIFWRGQCVLDIWHGKMGRDELERWHHDTLVNIFSAGKPIAAVLLLQLVERGLIGLDQPLAEHWPEFANHGKETITLRQLLSHTAGITAFHRPVAGDALFDWDTMIAEIEQESPWWEPGRKLGYSPILFGWLVGELYRKVTGQTMGQGAADLFQKLGQPFYFGVPETELEQVARMGRGAPVKGDPEATRLFRTMAQYPSSMTTLAFNNPMTILTSTNKPAWRAMELPSANGHSHARGLASFYQALLQPSALGVEPLLSPGLLQEAVSEQVAGEDRCLQTKTRFGLGFMLSQPDRHLAGFGPERSAFGHPGAGGSLAFADPVNEIAFAYVTNQMGPYVLVDPRADSLIAALYKTMRDKG